MRANPLNEMEIFDHDEMTKEEELKDDLTRHLGSTELVK